MNAIISGSYSRITHPTANNSCIAVLPKEVFPLIFSRSEDSDIVHLAETSKHFYCLLTYIPLWEPRLRDYFPDSYANLKSPAESPSLYKRLRIADYNIKEGNFIFSTLPGEHKDEVTGLALSGDLIISGSLDGTIKIQNIKSRQELHTLKGHEGWVTNILVCDGMAISGSYHDNTIKVWSLKDGKLLHTFEGYQGRENSLAVYGDHLIAGQYYGALRIWDLKSGQRLLALKGTQKQIQCITVCGDQLFSGSHDGTIAIWDLKTGKELTILRTNQELITSVMVYKDNLISGTPDGRIEIRNLKSGQIQTMNDPFGRAIEHLITYEGKLFSTHHIGPIRVFDLKTGEVHLLPKNGNNRKLEGRIFCNGQLIAEGPKGQVAILDFTDPSLLPPIKTLLPFLADLGIVTEKICLQKLERSSDFLPKIGICSSADVQALGVISPDFHYLEVVSEEVDNNYIKLEDAANKKTKIISSFLENLLEAVQKKSDEAEHHGIENIWIIFQNKLKGIKAEHDEACKIRRTRLEKFRPESYETIVAQMNGLIDEFKELDRKHQMNNQIVALSAYINQPDILKAWERLHSQGINSLAALLEKKEIDASVLFHIWDLAFFSYKEFE